uniref:Apyrase n=1 Tax=Corethrella appendiculata TaxID=1370023 RepID=U5EW72_9DIPT
MNNQILFIFILIILSCNEGVCSIIESNFNENLINFNTFPLSIIHLNDFHARYEETNLLSSKCKNDVGEECIGGYARVVTAVKKLLKDKKDKNPIYLNAGDNFQGTFWYTLLKWNVTSYFLNLLSADAMTLGNHEFDHGIEGVVPFLETIKSPIVVANIDDRFEPTFQNKYLKSTVIEKGGRKIGIVGVIHQKTNELSMTEKLLFLDEVQSVKEEADKLKNSGVDIVIVLSHCGLEVDRKIGKNAGENIDIIVGGHSHTFLFNGSNIPGPDIPADLYPVVVKQNSGHIVLIVQASAYTKYLGDITVYFNGKNEIIDWIGNPIYLDSSIPNDPDILRELEPWRDEIDKIGNRIVGKTKVLLSNDCRLDECNLGTFVTDAFLDYYIDKRDNSNEWTYASISITNAGGIRTGLEIGNLVYDDLVTSIPFENTIDAFELQGKYLLEALEYSGREYGKANFLQFTGLKVTYNVSKSFNENRVVSVDVLCRRCRVPRYEKLNLTEIYRLIVPNWIGGGGNNFTMFGNFRTNIKKGPLDIELFARYVAKMSPITKGTDGRIKIIY